ncbi:MAG: ABC transporter substrate-binding protein [Anaerolineales bacterium]|nr:ABC transporter substrate-binding protein [Chloroflexota bacterium]MBL6983765.1 ABC transporter substrate-binding protein [Anaerolineales bacterium]
MLRKNVFFMLILALVLMLTACQSATPEAPADADTDAPAEDAPAEAADDAEEPAIEMMSFTDDMGNTVEFTEYPQTIVALSPSMTEILFAIGAGDQVAGRDDFSLFPEEALAVPSVGSMWGELPTETILALEPDLVVAAQIVAEEQILALKDLGLQVYWQTNPEDFDGLYANLTVLGEISGHVEETEILIADLDARVKAVQEKVAPISYAPSVFYELDATDPSNPWTTGSGTFIDYIIAMAGGSNAASALEGEYTQISAEELISVNPQIILLADAIYGITVEDVAGRPGWDVIIAVQNNAIYPIDPNMMSVPGPRLVDALEETAKILHPDVFE